MDLHRATALVVGPDLKVHLDPGMNSIPAFALHLIVVEKVAGVFGLYEAEAALRVIPLHHALLTGVFGAQGHQAPGIVPGIAV